MRSQKGIVLLVIVSLVVAVGFVTAGLALAQEKPAAKEATKAQQQAAKQEAAKEEPAQKPEEKAQPSKPAAEEKPAQPAKPETYTVEPKPFKIELNLQAKFLPAVSQEIALRPKQWSALKVKQVVEHGAQVKKGDVLIQFDTERIDRAIADRQLALQLAEITLRKTEMNFELLEKTTPVTIARAERAKKELQEDHEYYVKVSRPMQKKSADFSLKQSEWFLEYELEELRQLEKMYKADELTEETEEIILKRQRNRVEAAKFSLENERLYHDRLVNVLLPRRDIDEKESFMRNLWSLEQAPENAKLNLEQARLELEKARRDLEEQRRQLEELKADRELLTVRAPFDGVVYYGAFKKGAWGDPSSIQEKLQPERTVTPGEVLMTVVRPSPLALELKIAEKDVRRIQPNMRAKVYPATMPDVVLSAVVKSVSTVPVTPGYFGAELSVTVPSDAKYVMPGTSCRVKLTPVMKSRTLVVPSSAVGTDPVDETRHYVIRISDDGKRVKQPVKIGDRSNGLVEILDGLVAGDKILKTYPKDAN